MINVMHIETDEELPEAFKIREKVYVEEQKIDRADEFDEYDKEAEHFLAVESDVPCGTARYRLTDEGIKLERFAVLPEYRKRGIASLLMETMLEYINIAHQEDKKIYLHAQVDVIQFYTNFDFVPEGDHFVECGIPHQKMVLNL